VCALAEMITLDGFPLTGTTRDGEWKRLGELEGWFDSPDPKRANAPRDRGDGNYRTEINYESRLITFNGRVESKNHEYLHQAASIVTALPGRGQKQFIVDGHGPTQWATVDPRGKVAVTFPTDTRMEFQIPLEAIDPFKYGEWRKFAASVGSDVAVFHRGNDDAVPYVVVSGSMPGGYTLSHAGSSVVVTEPLISGSPHTIDYRKRRLYKGGAPVRGGLSTASYAVVKSGQRDTFSITPGTTGTATATMTLYDTYI